MTYGHTGYHCVGEILTPSLPASTLKVLGLHKGHHATCPLKLHTTELLCHRFSDRSNAEFDHLSKSALG